jgi:hypothetical protein
MTTIHDVTRCAGEPENTGHAMFPLKSLRPRSWLERKSPRPWDCSQSRNSCSWNSYGFRYVAMRSGDDGADGHPGNPDTLV